MSDPLIRSCENYVVLEPGQEQKLLDVQQTISWLEEWLLEMKNLGTIQNYESNSILSAENLIDTACELEVKPGYIIKWFAVRLDPDQY